MIMRVQATLTPTESKKLLCWATAEDPAVKNALENGTVVIHPSSSTYFLIKALAGIEPKQWIFGAVNSRGTCGFKGTINFVVGKNYLGDPGGFTHSIVLKKGVLQESKPLVEVLGEMGPDDVYIKAANALDSDGETGVLVGSAIGGTIGRVIAAAAGTGFTILTLAGYEKTIPFKVRDVAKLTGVKKMDWATGKPVGLVYLPSQVMTESHAIKALFGLEAVPVAAGGIGVGQGSVTLVAEGDEENANRFIERITQLKQDTEDLPELEYPDCSVCGYATCFNRGK
jgi:hypothetical protein